MNYQIDDIIKFNNGEYLIIDVIRKNKNVYLYLINNDELKNDVAITKVINNNGNIEYKHIDNDDEFDYIINKIFLNLKDEIISFAIEE